MDTSFVESGTRAVAAEFLGTLLLVFFGVGAAVVAAEYVGSLGIALAFGLVLLALAYALGPVSGVHLNPAVTLGMLVAERIDLRRAVEYWVAQFVGGVVGAALLWLVAAQVPGVGASNGFGSNGFGWRSAVGVNAFGALLAEVVLTFLLVFVYLSVTRRLAVVGFSGVAVGLTLAAVHLVGTPLTGTSVNPARSLGPALFGGLSALSQVWLFLVAPMIGGLLAALVHRVTHSPTEPSLAETEATGTRPAV